MSQKVSKDMLNLRPTQPFDEESISSTSEAIDYHMAKLFATTTR